MIIDTSFNPKVSIARHMMHGERTERLKEMVRKQCGI
jgi:CheY-specific phosphatase CheX